jgi:XTP/dITP diphosphohydrolase
MQKCLQKLFLKEINEAKEMKFVIATHNKNKVKEFSRILNPLGIETVTLDLPEVEETGKTFMENAFLKADNACRISGLPAVADDSGLMVDALDGAPGLYSARYAGEGGTYDDVIEKLLYEMRFVKEGDRGAKFVSAICCVFPNGDKIEAQGECKGTIAFEKRGTGGFGYDPVFLVGDRSFAQLDGEEKDRISHRGIALRKFAEIIKNKI